MAGRIEDYAIVGDMQSVALIGMPGVQPCPASANRPQPERPRRRNNVVPEMSAAACQARGIQTATL